ncbi:MAG: protein kinase [Polyangiaceae bacterium]
MSVRPSPPSRLYEPNEPIPGTVYRVLKLLAQGGMGNVYDVEDVTVGKRYVLKTLTPDLVGRTDLTRRMDAEARVLARLSHPNIVEVITAGTTADSLALPFLVMERLYGQSLRTVLDKRGAVEFPYACKVAIDLLDALEHAHEHGVIHRDVKPENVFLHRTPFGVTVTKLLDFGVMRLSDARVRETQGRFVGTLRYAAPEQLTAQQITPAVDIYAAALVLYELLCGVGPFDDEETSAKIAKAHVTREAPRASTHVSLPAAVDELLARALSKNPAERPADAFSFAAELRKVASPLRVSEAPPSSAPTHAHPMPVVSTAASPALNDAALQIGASSGVSTTPKTPANLDGDTPPTRGTAGDGIPTEFLTEVAGAAPPLDRAATLAASSPLDPRPAVVIDRGAPTRSMVAEEQAPVPPTNGAPASLRRTAPLVAPTPVPNDFQFAKESAPAESTEPSAISSEPRSRARSPYRAVWWLAAGACGIVLVALVFVFAVPRLRHAASTGGVTSERAEPRAEPSSATVAAPQPSALAAPLPTVSPLPSASTDAAVSAGTSFTPSSHSTAPARMAPSGNGASTPSRATVARPQGSGQGTKPGQSGPASKLPGIDF